MMLKKRTLDPKCPQPEIQLNTQDLHEKRAISDLCFKGKGPSTRANRECSLLFIQLFLLKKYVVKKKKNIMLKVWKLWLRIIQIKKPAPNNP